MQVRNPAVSVEADPAAGTGRGDTAASRVDAGHYPGGRGEERCALQGGPLRPSGRTIAPFREERCALQGGPLRPSGRTAAPFREDRCALQGGPLRPLGRTTCGRGGTAAARLISGGEGVCVSTLERACWGG